MAATCIFCRIVAGELPSVKIYEDAEILAFMDIGPIIKGHALVIPKQHVELITGAPDPMLARLISVARVVADAQITGLGASGVNITQANGRSAGQVVPHLHFHVIPRFDHDGHSWNWNAKRYETPEEMTSLASRIQAAIGTSAGKASHA